METKFKTANAIVFERPGKSTLKEISLPPVDDDTVIVKTKYSAISAGTEMNIYNGLTPPLDGNLWYPLIPGYEEVGEVVWTGADVNNLQVGDRVIANEVRYYPEYCSAWGGQVEYAVKNSRTAFAPFDSPVKIPDNVTYEEAVVAYLACVSRKGLAKVNLSKGEVILIIGQGCIGISAAQLAKLYGATVIVADLYKKRLNIAKKYADYVITAGEENILTKLKDITNKELADVVFEASGNPEIIPELADMVKPEGRIHLQGYYTKPFIITEYHRWFGKDLTITMSCALRLEDKVEILKLISEGNFDAKSMISEVVSVHNASEAYEKMNECKHEIIKLIFKWD